MASHKPESLVSNSPTAQYVLASRLVADLHQRSSFDVPALLRELIGGAAESVPGAQYAGVSVTQRRRPSNRAAATHHYAQLLDDIQNRCGQGPGMTAGALQETVRVDDLGSDDRWPLYRDEVINQTPIRSILSLDMFKEGSTYATLNFYAESTHAFDDAAAELGALFATHAGLVWNMMQRDQQFRAALISRDVIGQAKGRMMERFNIDATEAFDMLKLMSQDSNTPIAQVAQRVVAGEVWPSPE
ncbi:GAF and ANTAR domain-containing protein [Candidatus Mycobacterium wuenschmannii]|uniref:GAF and ANTAR domain-containing protein n=1 Tax=Candidatus Mycobacterium wuenschmannii TaxID=3027808 RepID=A0ABY8W120_9MYCO|nr:GAF and ANTAR domain-containing protein [Candidatus Mycobacterium wuenschmannii]WIM88147.1 GAF and ANTAR domain-containing protein [Candidatus Mycobacterium wuenschmannii]